MNYAERVKEGAKFLDKELTYDWRSRIDLETLDLSMSSKCILGQLYGNYGRALDKLMISWNGGEELGFIEIRGEVAKLAKAWKEYLTTYASNPCGEVNLTDAEPCTIGEENTDDTLYIVFRYIADATKPGHETQIIVLATHNETTAGGAVMALNHAGIKCRKTEVKPVA